MSIVKLNKYLRLFLSNLLISSVLSTKRPPLPLKVWRRFYAFMLALDNQCFNFVRQ